jgi:hypothetical protein
LGLDNIINQEKRLLVGYKTKMDDLHIVDVT